MLSGRLKKVLLVVKKSAYELYIQQHQDPHVMELMATKHPAIRNLLDRHAAHHLSLQQCREALSALRCEWSETGRDLLSKHGSIADVDLVVAVGGDGTVLEASHHIGSHTPILGVNSDPTDWEEVRREASRFDARRSTGHLCVATSANLCQILDDLVSGRRRPRPIARMQVKVGGRTLPTPALNDVLVAHPNPAASSRFSFSVRADGEANSPQDRNCTDSSTMPVTAGNADMARGSLGKGSDVAVWVPAGGPVHVPSSGLRACTATGSTAAMASAGGWPMDPYSQDLQYMVREPLPPVADGPSLPLHGLVGPPMQLHLMWGCRRGCIFIDGSHLHSDIRLGSTVDLSMDGPPLHILLPDR